MAEYIEREKLLEELEKIPAYFDSGDTRYGIEIAIDQTKKQPTADVVEVVRCSNCVKYEPDIIADGVGWCDKFECGMYDNDFCSFGKLKDSENDA
jgi:hypothetical protein